MLGARKPEIRAAAEAIFARFQAAGGVPVDADILQSADVLLDLYGEDIRARAYVTSDPLLGEQMLRPDFTVPVVQAHMTDGAEPARYTYMGEVFRRQEAGSARAQEFMQVGYEVFDRRDPAAADAEVFALFADVLAPLGLHPATGDIGILMAAVRALDTSEQRKNALLRHLWRPRRFRALLERYAGRTEVPHARADLLDSLAQYEPAELLAAAGPLVGLRDEAEILARIEVLRADAQEPPIAPEQVAILDDILGIRCKAPAALARLRGIAADLPAIAAAVQHFERRLAALAGCGIDVGGLDFEASYGRTTLEYYDGFVFGFYAEGRADLPPVATGGRYDALTRVLGQGKSIPAVGGVIRPDLVQLLGGLGA